MGALVHRPVFDVAVPKDWRWRTQDDLYLRPVVMETRHLHHTLVMIWHHTMPADARVRNYYRRYSFSSWYSEEYMRQAVNVMARELSTRDNLQPFMRDELRRMAEYLRPNAGRISQLRKLQDLRQSN